MKIVIVDCTVILVLLDTCKFKLEVNMFAKKLIFQSIILFKYIIFLNLLKYISCATASTYGTNST